MERTGEAPFLRGRKILIVEDEMLIALELENIAKGLGCTVVGPVPDVPRALALLEQELPDVAFLDLNLNGTPSTPIASALSARGVPFLVVTGYRRMLSDNPVLESAPWLTKPVSAPTLTRALGALLGPA